MRPYLLAFFACAIVAFPAGAAEQRYPDDAALHAVQFLDAEVGYAAGDDGVILKTINAGKTWELLPSGVQCSLRSVHMLTHLVGWVVGRVELPGGARSAGVVLHTQDGGETWQRVLADTVPGLNHIRFADTDTAFMIGDCSAEYPTGIFVTTDAGRKWRPLKGPLATSWLGGDFLDVKTGALAGAWSRLGAIQQGNYGILDMAELGGRNLCGVHLRRPWSFVVGQGGLVLRGREGKDGGLQWDFADTKLPEDVLAAWDFHAVACVGDKVWIVGRPGSAVLCSEDQGATWKTHKTGHSLPLNGVHFFDQHRGWAVGEFGAILTTVDGGKTWTVQRRGGQRAAVLCVHARAEDLPVDTIAMLGGDQGLLTAAVQVAAPDPRSEPLWAAAQAQRLAAAHRAAGGGAAELLWQFPLPQDFWNADKTAVLKLWDRLHGDHADQQLLRQLVLTIRIWQPDVVLTDHPDIKATGSAASALVCEAVHEACKQAADPKAFPEQIQHLGLQAWRVARVYGLWDRQGGSHVAVDNTREILPLHVTCAECAAGAGALLASNPPAMPMQRFYRLLAATQDGVPKDLLDGINRGAVGGCRRPLLPVDELDEKLTAAIKMQRQLVAQANNPAPGLAELPQLLGRLSPVLAKLPEDRAAKAVFAVAVEFVRQGEWDLAREAYLELVKRYPLHPLAVDSYRWLIRHNASSEARRRHELGQFLVVAVRGEADRPDPAADPKKPDPSKPGQVQQAAFISNAAELLHWHLGSLTLAKQLGGFGRIHADDPSLQFCLQASNRLLGKIDTAQKFCSAYYADHAEGPWREAAAQELWFTSRTGVNPRPVAECRFTPARPYLDGKFDDECWKGQKPLVLKDAIHATAKAYPTEAMLSYDDKFLYIALRCKHPAGQGVPPAKERPRDADLRAFDRVSILLDLDRDYSTFFHLEVDQRGCVFEDCWGDKRWNPQWFVAINSDEESWQIEAAIPIHELTGDRVVPGSAWACNIVRILPGRGVQGWSTPAGVQPRPEGMALMVFKRDQP